MRNPSPKLRTSRAFEAARRAIICGFGEGLRIPAGKLFALAEYRDEVRPGANAKQVTSERLSGWQAQRRPPRVSERNPKRNIASSLHSDWTRATIGSPNPSCTDFGVRRNSVAHGKKCIVDGTEHRRIRRFGVRFRRCFRRNSGIDPIDRGDVTEMSLSRISATFLCWQFQRSAPVLAGRRLRPIGSAEDRNHRGSD